MPPRLFLLDGSALAYRAHFAMADARLSAPDGRSVGATFGFTREIKDLLDREQPSHIAIVFDTSAKTFRHDLYPDYKATRERMPEDLAEQLPLLKEAARALGVPVLELDGYEADDLMGTLALRGERAGMEVFLVTGDKDFMQLIRPQIHMLVPARRGDGATLVGEAEVRAKFGVPPGQVIDVLGLMGDASDNVPGVPGVGEKTAAKLIVQFGTIEALLASPMTEVSPKVRQSLQANRELALLSKRLVTIDTAVPYELDPSALAWSGPRAEEAASLFRSLGFRTLTASMEALLRERSPGQSAPAANDYRLIIDATGFEALWTKLTETALVAIDTETTGLEARHARIVGLSFAWSTGQAAYVPLNAEPDVLPRTRADEPGSGVLDRLKPWLEDPTRHKCGQNLKYDLQVLKNHGIELAGIATDSLIGSFLIEPEQRERGIDALALRHFRHEKIRTAAVIGSGPGELGFADIEPEKVMPYAAEDADYALRLSELFLADLEAGSALRKLHDEIEIPLVPVLARMERHGVRLDRGILVAMTEELEAEARKLELEIHALAGQSFNLGSPKQLGEVVFEKLKLHEALGVKPRKTKTGWATDQESLEELGDHPLIQSIITWRGLTKLLSTYIRVLPELIDPTTGRIHTSFHQTGAATGRLSSSDPNLQNIPIRTKTGRRIREAFIARDEDHVLLSADYSQVELRIMAHISEDEGLLEAFRNGRDVHAETAARIFGVPRDAVPPDFRARAKAVNFGVLYGMGPQRLARENGISTAEAKEFIQKYFQAFPSIQAFIESLKQKARDCGYAETLLGRRRKIPELGSKNRALQIAAENMAVNTPIQGSAADILKLAMVAIDRRLQRENRRAAMILTVHDELVFDLPRAEAEAVKELVVHEMAHAYPLRLPLAVSAGMGPNWLAAH